jgi:predicted anti-sigma-YlaC factor YlaD
MSHVTEKLAEFIFEELPAPEMAEARRHVAECTQCREQVSRFQQTLSVLQTAPDLEPPRNLVFEFEKPTRRRFWRWFPAAAALAGIFVMAVALAGRVHVQWNDSKLTIAFGDTVTSSSQPDAAAALATEIQRMKGHLAYLEDRQQAVERNTMVMAATIQPIVQAQRPPTGD